MVKTPSQFSHAEVHTDWLYTTVEHYTGIYLQPSLCDRHRSESRTYRHGPTAIYIGMSVAMGTHTARSWHQHAHRLDQWCFAKRPRVSCEWQLDTLSLAWEDNNHSSRHEASPSLIGREDPGLTLWGGVQGEDSFFSQTADLCNYFVHVNNTNLKDWYI